MRKPPFRSRDAESRRAAYRSVARNKRLPTLPSSEPPPPTADAPQPAAEATPAPASTDAPVPWGWETDGREIPPPGRRFFSSGVQDPPAAENAPVETFTSGGGNVNIPPTSDIAGAPRPDRTGLEGAEARAAVGTFTGEVAVGLPGAEAKTAAVIPISATLTAGSSLTANATVIRVPDDPPEPDKRKSAARGLARPRTKRTARGQTKQGAITNRAGVIQHTKILIIALQETLDYDPVRDHNQRPPILWSGDPSYLKDVKDLVVELRRLNSLLEAQRPRKKEAERAVIDLARHFDKFLHAYASWFGKGTALLTVVVIANLLQHAGLDPTAVCSAIKLPHV